MIALSPKKKAKRLLCLFKQLLQCCFKEGESCWVWPGWGANKKIKLFLSKLNFFSLLRLSLLTAKTLGDARVIFQELKILWQHWRRRRC